MSNFPGYKTKTFSPSQKFFVLDPNTGSPAFVQGSDLVAQITPNSNYVYAESTRTTAQATDYPLGAVIQTGGATSAGDNLAGVYLVVPSGEGDFPMDNGNELLVLAGDDTLREQLAENTEGGGSDLVAHTGTSDTVTEVLDKLNTAVDKRTIYVGSVAEPEGLSLAEGVNVYLTQEGRAGSFVVKTGTPPSDPKKGIYIVLANGNYAERIVLSYVNVDWFGAAGDGLTDDTSALMAADSLCNSLGKTLEFTYGKSYTINQDTTKKFTCSISGKGATLTNISGVASVGNTGSACVATESTSDLFIYGLTVNGQLYGTGFSNNAGDRIYYRDCNAINCLHGGFMNYNGNSVVFENCSSENIRYNPDGSGSADGFYSASANNVIFLNCRANDFRRIGFVTEGTGVSDRSYNPKIIGCLATNANNCDDSPTEFNAGFWFERTNGGYIDNCSARFIAGNAGQTSGRVIGIVIDALGDTDQGQSVLSNTDVYGGSGYLPVGVQAGSDGNISNVVITNVLIDKYRKGISSSGGFKTLTISNLSLNDGDYAAGSSGGILLDLGARDYFDKITISNVDEANAIYTNADAGTINIFSAAANGRGAVDIENCDSITLVTRQAVGTLNVTNCGLKVRSSAYARILGDSVYFSNVKFSNNGGTLNVGSPSVRFKDCSITGFDPIAVTNNTSFVGTEFVDSRVTFQPSSGNVKLRVNNCDWENASQNCIYSNFYDVIGDSLIVYNTNFTINTAAVEAVKLWSFQPDTVVLQGNTYNTVLTDMTPTSSANNVAV